MSFKLITRRSRILNIQKTHNLPFYFCYLFSAVHKPYICYESVQYIWEETIKRSNFFSLKFFANRLIYYWSLVFLDSAACSGAKNGYLCKIEYTMARISLCKISMISKLSWCDGVGICLLSVACLTFSNICAKCNVLFRIGQRFFLRTFLFIFSFEFLLCLQYSFRDRCFYCSISL